MIAATSDERREAWTERINTEGMFDVLGGNVLSALIDADIVTDYASDYGEPGYSLGVGKRAVLLGDWWCRDRDCSYPERDSDGRRKVHGIEYHYPRLMAALDDVAELEWYDEWMIATPHDVAYRTQADSYSWQPSVVFPEDGDPLAPEDGVDAWIEWAVDDPTRVIPSVVWSTADLTAAGFAEYQCGFESGWHPGQTDDPREITQLIRDERGEDVEILFHLSHTGQFDIGFCVFVREDGEQ